MQVSIALQHALITTGIAYGIPAAIYILIINKIYGERLGIKSKVIKASWLIALIIFAIALTPITREILYPSSNSAASQNEIYKGILLVFPGLLTLLLGYLVGFFMREENAEERTQNVKADAEFIEQAKTTKSIKKNENSLLKDLVDAFHDFKAGYKAGKSEFEDDSKNKSPARFVNLKGESNEKIPRTLSDYLWQSIFSVLISLAFGFVAYEAVVKLYENENSITNLLGIFFSSIGFLIFIGLALIYVFRFFQVVNERGIRWKDFILEGQLLAVVILIGFLATTKII
jgi:uncharacterized membrane protein YidH (DUF202 family)